MNEITNTEHLTNHDRLMKLLYSYQKVQLNNNDDYDEKLVWCLENCKGKFHDTINEDGKTWYFEKEEDVTLFLLRWS